MSVDPITNQLLLRCDETRGKLLLPFKAPEEDEEDLEEVTESLAATLRH